jgi:gliding motility-associated-like protein
VTTDSLLCFDGDATFNISTVNTSLHSGSQWRYDVLPVNYPAGVTGSWAGGLTDQTSATLTDNLTNTTDLVQTVTYIFIPHIRPGDGDPECGDGVPDTVKVDLDPQPKITVPPVPLLCFDGNAVFNISTVNSALHAGSLWRYDVQVNYPVGVTGSWAAGLSNQTALAPADDLTNTTDVAQTVTYYFTPHIRPGDGGSECLNGIQVVLNVVIDPQPRLFPKPPDNIQCDSTLTSIVLQSPNIFSNGLISFDETVTADGTITGYPVVPVTGLPNNHLIADRLVNQTDAWHTVTYRIVPVSPAGCASGFPVDIKVTVNPTPRVIPLNPNSRRDSSICFGGTTSVVLTSPTVMTSGSIRFDYTVSVTGGPGVVIGNTTPQTDRIPGYTLSYPYLNTSDTLQSVFYNIRPKVDNAICVPGQIVSSQIRVHARPLQLPIIITTPLTCNGGSDAALHANSSKGAGPYYFDWVRPGTDHIFGYGITDLINVKGGRWEVTVTDNLGCTTNPPGSIFIAGAFFDEYMYVVDTSGYGTTCPGSNDGELWIKEKSSSTAVGPFEYWLVRNGTDTIMHNFLPATEVYQRFNNLPIGSYKLYIKDSNGCQNDWNNPPEAIITEPPVIQAQFTASQYTGNFNISCKGYNDGSVVAEVSGGNGGYSYKWHTIDGSFSGPDTMARLDSLTAGTYYLQTTDRKGCVKTDSIKITEPEGMILSGYGIHDITCFGGNDGFIKLTITGGSGNYSYSWTGPGSFTANTKDISDLIAGSYRDSVLDVNGCVLTPVPNFDLTEPPLLVITALPSSSSDGAYNINCFGGTGSVDITVTGGIPATYIYEWSTSDGAGIIAGQEDQPALKAGTYHLKVTDLNNCIATADITLTQPAAISLNIIATDITCQAAGFDNGSIDLVVSGGIPPYSYLWSNGAVTEDISGLTQGSYRVTVTDINGCTRTDSARVDPSPPVTYNKTVSDYNGYQITCNGMADGYITIDPTTGAPPFTFAWTGPDGFSATTNAVTGLKAGTYTMTVTDNNSCTATETFVMGEPGKIGLEVALSSSIAGGYNINCAGEFTGSIDIDPVNSAGAVDYLWSDGIFGKTRTGLQAGDYRVIISDANNCHADTTVTLTQPDSIKIVPTILKPLCPDKPDGRISLTITGGVRGAGYNYSWSDNTTDSTLTNISAGTYSVTVSDLNLCKVMSTMKVDPENRMCLVIPEAFSPNGDGINDVWNIGLTDLYPDIEITIYNRWGQSVWRSARGYPVPWDGRSNGRDVPVDSYHYFIDLHNGSRPLIGSVTIVR